MTWIFVSLVVHLKGLLGCFCLPKAEAEGRGFPGVLDPVLGQGLLHTDPEIHLVKGGNSRRASLQMSTHGSLHFGLKGRVNEFIIKF